MHLFLSFEARAAKASVGLRTEVTEVTVFFLLLFLTPRSISFSNTGKWMLDV